jgi:hypothetical protein
LNYKIKSPRDEPFFDVYDFPSPRRGFYELSNNIDIYVFPSPRRHSFAEPRGLRETFVLKGDFVN